MPFYNQTTSRRVRFQCLGEDTEKDRTLSVPTKSTKIGNHKIENKIYWNCVRFMATFLSSLTDNLAEGLHEGKCKDCEWSCE